MKTRIVQDGRGEGGDEAATASAGPVAGDRGAVPGGSRTLVRRHPVVTLFVLSCALSWCLLPVGTFLPPSQPTESVPRPRQSPDADVSSGVPR